MLKHKDLIDFTQNPFELFNNWYDLACETEINDPNAMTISTILNELPAGTSLQFTSIWILERTGSKILERTKI